MLNFYQLLQVIGLENENAVSAVRDSFNADFRDYYHAIQINNTTRKNAVLAYGKAENLHKDEKTPGAYTDGTTALYIPDNDIIDAVKTADVCKFFTDAFKTRRPVDLHLKETVATARALGWTPATNTRYHIEIDGSYFDFSLVYRVFQCIADNKRCDGLQSVELCDMVQGTTTKRLLLLTSKYGCAIVLPFVCGAPAEYNVNFNYYIQVQHDIDNYIVNSAKKGA